MTSWRAIALVAQREITERIRGRTTWLLTALTAALAVVLVALPAVLSQPARPTNLGLVGPDAQALAPQINASAAAARIQLVTANVDSEATARSELTPSTKAGGGGRLRRLFSQTTATLDVALVYDGTTAKIEGYQAVPPGISALLRSVVNAVHLRSALSGAGLSASQVAAAARPVPTAEVTLQPAPGDLSGRAITALAGAFLLMYSVAGFGTAVAIGVAQEKTSRTAEVLLAAVRPRELMTGKVVGIGLVGLGQVTVTVGAALVANAVIKSQSIPPQLPTLLPLVILWFVLGFTLYAFGFAAAGAMVARQEEVQTVTLPFTLMQVVAFMLVYVTIASPDAPVIRVLSFLPPFSPILIPARLALSHVEIWEVPLAAAIELAAIVGMARLAGRIYQAALVRGGARLGWGAALRLR